MTHDPSLAQLYSQELRPIIEELETRRLQLRNQALITSIGLLPTTPIVGFLLFGALGAFFGGLAALTFVFRFNHHTYQGYRKHFKDQVIRRLVKSHKLNLRYDPAGGIHQEEFAASQIFTQRIDRYHREDLVSGKIGETSFRFSDIDVETKKGQSKGQGEFETLFRGSFFVANFNKSFRGTTVVAPDIIGQLLGGVRSQGQGTKSSRRGMEIVRLEDPEFDRMFIVFSTDQVEARYILSTSLMQRLLDFVNQRRNDPKAPQWGIAFSFVRSKVYIAFPGKNHFEPPSLFAKPEVLSSLEGLQSYLAEMQIAEDIVKELNLNRRIWGRNP